ncbi:MAG: cobyrinate a,c-diamide synthase [Aphanocapsa sp. GSE-SYN-MK-11-07L]|nr:cobyrinate a,c-diamide synthase [Aphanocapsa sp. GSE-SYN-MK-11-07L]
MTLVIAGDRSGVGKTTITLALLAALRQRGLAVQSFKVGPDYIDPMFHQFVTGRPCRNLDPVLTSEHYVQKCFSQHSQTSHSLIEGVMGLFDGAGGTDWGSTAHIARLLNLPILLVLDCASLSGSVAAIAHGFKTFDPRLKLAGLVLNRVGSDRHQAMLTEALAPLGLPILGVLRRQSAITIPDRHLGLVPTAELPDLRSLVDQLAYLGEACFDWQQLLPLLQTSQICPDQAISEPALPDLAGVRVAIAHDQAFSFYYPDNLDALADLGAELVSWSPLQDAGLPAGVQGLYLGGGFPEMFAPALAANLPARQSVRQALQAGLPTYAECGGLMYLCQQIETLEQESFPMVGVLPAQATMGQRLSLGYRQAIALRDTPLLSAGTGVWGHEFHRSQLLDRANAPIFTTTGFRAKSTPASALTWQPEGWQQHQVHASYIHLHWGDRLELPRRFLSHCRAYGKQVALTGLFNGCQ